MHIGTVSAYPVFYTRGKGSASTAELNSRRSSQSNGRPRQSCKYSRLQREQAVYCCTLLVLLIIDRPAPQRLPSQGSGDRWNRSKRHTIADTLLHLEAGMSRSDALQPRMLPRRCISQSSRRYIVWKDQRKNRIPHSTGTVQNVLIRSRGSDTLSGRFKNWTRSRLRLHCPNRVSHSIPGRCTRCFRPLRLLSILTLNASMH